MLYITIYIRGRPASIFHAVTGYLEVSRVVDQCQRVKLGMALKNGKSMSSEKKKNALKIIEMYVLILTQIMIFQNVK